MFFFDRRCWKFYDSSSPRKQSPATFTFLWRAHLFFYCFVFLVVLSPGFVFHYYFYLVAFLPWLLNDAQTNTSLSFVLFWSVLFIGTENDQGRKTKQNDFVLFSEPPPLCLAHRERGKHDLLPVYLVYFFFLVCHTFNWYLASCVSTRLSGQLDKNTDAGPRRLKNSREKVGHWLKHLLLLLWSIKNASAPCTWLLDYKRWQQLQDVIFRIMYCWEDLGGGLTQWHT